MAVKLRLRRMGKKNRPFYRIVAADSRAPRDGRFIELIGTYDPVTKPHSVEMKEDRVLHWLKNGAQPTRTVKNLLQGNGLWLKWDLTRNGADEAKIAEEFGKWELVRKEKVKRLEAKEAQKLSKKAKEKVKEDEEAPVTEVVAEPVEAAAVEAVAEVAEAPVEEAKPEVEETVEKETEKPEKSE